MSEILDRNGNQNSQPNELGDSLRRLNSALRKIPTTRAVPDELQLEAEALDSLWVYDDVACVFSGLCQVVRSDEISAQPRLERVEATVGDTSGFHVTDFSEGNIKHWIVSWGFETTVDENGKEIIEQYYLNTGFDHEVVPICEIDTAHGALQQHSDVLADLMKHDNFFALNVTNQRGVVNRFMIAGNQEMALHDLRIDRPIELQGEYGYMLVRNKHEVTYESVDLKDVYAKGKFSGLSVLGKRQLDMGQKIIDTEDLVHNGSGLCYVVQLDLATATALEIPESKRLYVPISGQKLSVDFKPNDLSRI